MYIYGHDGPKNYTHGAEYETGPFRGYMKTLHNHDVPCAVCLVEKLNIIMNKIYYMLNCLCIFCIWYSKAFRYSKLFWSVMAIVAPMSDLALGTLVTSK